MSGVALHRMFFLGRNFVKKNFFVYIKPRKKPFKNLKNLKTGNFFSRN